MTAPQLSPEDRAEIEHIQKTQSPATWLESIYLAGLAAGRNRGLEDAAVISDQIDVSLYGSTARFVAGMISTKIRAAKEGK